MGIEHSVVRERRIPPKNDEVLVINRTDVNLPETYGTVELSDEVLKRINSNETENLDNFSTAEPEIFLSVDEQIDQTQRKFDETATRVEQIFLTKQYQNACSEIEKSIVSCLSLNSQCVLNCQYLLDTYKDCIGKYKSKLIQDQFLHANQSI